MRGLVIGRLRIGRLKIEDWKIGDWGFVGVNRRVDE